MRLWWRKQRELRDELDSHLRMAAQDRIDRGEDAVRARQLARRELGNETLIRETARDQWGLRWLETLLQDLRYAIRMLRKSPGFTIVAVLTLALGIGSVTVIFSAVYGVILNTFPFRDAGQVTSFAIQDLTRPRGGREFLSMPEFLYFRQHSRTFQDFSGEYGGYGTTPVRYTTASGTYQFDADYLSVNSFRFFGVKPLLGRLPTREDVRPGATPVFVMGAKLWHGEFNSDPEIVGKSFTLNGVPTTLVGIMPPRFRWAWVDVWIPFSVDPAQALTNPILKTPVVYTVGRLKPGVTLAEAAADLNVIAHQYAKIAPADYPKKFTMTATSLSDRVTGGFKQLIYPLLGAVLLLLLIACSNIANLLLSRATVREKEIAIRAALGATRARLVRQLLVESLLLAVSGCVVGCVLAWAAIRVMVPLIPYDTFPQEAVIALNPIVLGLAVAVAMVSTVLFGLVPALQSVRGELNPRLIDSSRTSTYGLRQGWLRSALVISEVAISIVLLVGAGLMMRTFWNIKNVDLGFDPSNVLAVHLSFPQTGGDQQTNQENIISRKILEHLKSVPGVATAAIVAAPPSLGAGFGTEITVAGKTHAERWTALLNMCSEEYFDLLHMRILHGRAFSRGDVELAHPVAVISRSLATKYFGAHNPLGQSVHFAILDGIRKFKGVPFEIIGVVSDIKNGDPRRAPTPEAYIPYTVAGADGNTLLVKSLISPGSLVPTLRQQFWRTDSELALDNPTTLEAMLQRNVFASPEFEFTILTTFAAIALGLVVAGIFSVMAYTVSLRTHEIGVRMALGALPEGILKMILAKGVRLAAIGIVFGVGAALAATRLLQRFLFDIQPTDSATFVTVSVLVIAVALLACWIPARRAMRVDPMVALRHE